MSRIGKAPIKIPNGVTVNIDGQKVTVSGKLGKLDYSINENISVNLEENELVFTRNSELRQIRAFHGMSRALVNNMVVGVSQGFEKILQIIGTGYTAELVGPWLKLSLGYSHDILVEIPEGITVKAEKAQRTRGSRAGVQATVSIAGIRKDVVGSFAAEVRKCRPPENYKGKGIRYSDEHVVIKPGKSGAKA